MKTHKHTIKLLIKNITDKQLLTNYLQELGYIINESLSDEWSKFSMIITDEFYARQFGRNLLIVKNQPGVIFFPVVILLPVSFSGSAWIDAGFDDVLRLPVLKAELAEKLKILLRLREETQKKYQEIFENIQIGIYWMNSKNRILVTNNAFLSILEYESREKVLHRNLLELGVKFQEDREVFFEKIKQAGKISGYESCWILKNNKKIYIRESANLFQDQDDFYYIGTIENITSSKNKGSDSVSSFYGETNYG